jgi:1-deoxy-D-xylulose-5-phosphate synthase
VAITAAMPNGTGLDLFRRTIPSATSTWASPRSTRWCFAAGMATRGFRPVCAIYSTFLQRAFDPIVHDVCLQKLPVVFCMDRAGLSGDDGPTHHGLFDISYLRGIPEIVLMVAQGRRRAGRHDEDRLELPGPSAIRYPRGAVAGVARKPEPQVLPIGKAEVLAGRLRRGHSRPRPHDLAGAGTGRRLERDGYSAAVINPRFVKPLDREMLERYAAAWPPSSPLKIT